MSSRFAKSFAVLDPGPGAGAGVVQTGITRRRFTSGERGFVLINPRAAAPTKQLRPTPRKPRASPVVVVPFQPQILISRLKEKGGGFVPPSKGGMSFTQGPDAIRRAAAERARKAACPTCAAPAVVRPDLQITRRAPAPVLKFDPAGAAPAKRGAEPKKGRRGFLLFLLLAAIAVGALRAGVLRAGLDRPVGRGNPGHGNPGSSAGFITVRGKKRPICPKCRALKKLGLPCKRCGKA